MINVLKYGLLSLVTLLSLAASGNTADFTWTSECEGTQTFFVSTSTASSGTITQYQWDFDNDGFFDEAVGATASWLFDSAGTWMVGHRIITSMGQTADVYLQVTVNDVPNVTYTVTEVCEGNPSVLTDITVVQGAGVASRNWDLDNDGQFDDGTAAVINNVFSGAGAYTVGLQLTTDSGCVGSVYQSFTVHPNPTVGFTFSEVCIGDTTQFHGEADVATGYIASYDWELNGNNFYDDASGQDITNEFISTGNYQIGLQVTTDRGCQADTTILVTIAPLPLINFSFAGQCMENPVSFTNLSINQVGTIGYDWAFGDGGASTIINPTHTYNSPGTFSVVLTGTTSFGCVSSLSQNIMIRPSPKGEFDYTEVCLGEETSFTNESEAQGATIESYFWDFDDGEVSVAPNPNHTYDEPGTYQVSLVVYSTEGCRDTITHLVNVWDLPDATISASGPTSFCLGESVDLAVNLDVDEDALWSTGVGTSGINVTASGTYDVLVYDDNGCEDRDMITITVWELPVLDISNDTNVSLGYDVPLWVSGAEQYSWSPVDYLDDPFSDMPTAVSPLQDITYEVTATDANGCVNTTSVVITINSDYVLEPVNLFTPNGDGTNDYFNIRNAELYSDCELVVFNRWGNEVYRSASYQNDWDGTYKGQELPEGSYYYMLKCGGTDKVYDGSVSILRVKK